jgi:hypothetical protein
MKNVNNCWNTNIYSYLETSGGQSSNLHLNVVHFFNNIRHLWQLKTVVFLHRCLICAALLVRHYLGYVSRSKRQYAEPVMLPSVEGTRGELG